MTVGYKSWTDEKGWNGVNNRTVLDSELVTKKQLLQSNLDLHLRCQKLGVKHSSIAVDSCNSKMGMKNLTLCFLADHVGY